MLTINFLPSYAYENKTNEMYSYIGFDGKQVNYYKDIDGNNYVIENGEKIYIAIPVLKEKVTDENIIEQLKSYSQIAPTATNGFETLPYSKTLNFSTTIVKTGVFHIVSGSYIYLKCSKLNPSNAKRGFSYYIYYSPDNVAWERALFVNESLLFYTRHRLADLGNGPYIYVQIWSYYGTVQSCLLSMK